MCLGGTAVRFWHRLHRGPTSTSTACPGFLLESYMPAASTLSWKMLQVWAKLPWKVGALEGKRLETAAESAAGVVEPCAAGE